MNKKKVSPMKMSMNNDDRESIDAEALLSEILSRNIDEVIGNGIRDWARNLNIEKLNTLFPNKEISDIQKILELTDEDLIWGDITKIYRDYRIKNLLN